MRKNGFQRPYNTMQIITWITLPTFILQFLLFITPLLIHLPPSSSSYGIIISTILTALYLLAAWSCAYHGYKTCVTDPMDERLERHLCKQKKREERMKRMSVGRREVGDDVDDDVEEDDEEECGEKKKEKKKGGENVGNGSKGRVATMIGHRLGCHPMKKSNKDSFKNESNEKDDIKHNDDEDSTEENPDENNNNEETKFCWVCQTNVDETSMHCKFCEKCVRRFDHHCMWLNTCVGKRNYHYFFRTVVSTFLFTLFHVLVLIGVIVSYFAQQDDDEGMRKAAREWMNMGGSGIFVILVNIVFLIIIMVALSLIGQLLFFHLGLQRENITTYEYIVRDSAKKRERNRTMVEADRRRNRALSDASAHGRYGEMVWLHCGKVSVWWMDPVRREMKEEERQAKLAEEAAAASVGDGGAGAGAGAGAASAAGNDGVSSAVASGGGDAEDKSGNSGCGGKRSKKDEDVKKVLMGVEDVMTQSDDGERNEHEHEHEHDGGGKLMLEAALHP